MCDAPTSLLFLVQKSRVALKARDSLLLLVGLSAESAASCMVRSSALCSLLAQHLCHLHGTLSPRTDPMDVLAMGRVSWRYGVGHQPYGCPGYGGVSWRYGVGH